MVCGHIHAASVALHLLERLGLFNHILYLLPHLPGFEGFRGVQEEAVRAALQGELAAAATSYGSIDSRVSYMSKVFLGRCYLD